MEERLRIVAIDDDCETLGFLNRILDPEGYQVTIASNGMTALAMLDDCKPHLVILDASSPEFDGFEILHYIRQRWDVPVIMLSNDDDILSLVRALGMGADDYMRKPFGRKELAARVRAKLRRAWSVNILAETNTRNLLLNAR